MILNSASASGLALQVGGSTQATLTSGQFAFAAAGTLTTGSNTLTVTSSNFNLASTGALTVAGNQTADITTPTGGTANKLTVQPGVSTVGSGTGATLFLLGGNQSAGTSTGGGVSIDAGTGGTANGAVTIGGSNAASIGLGRSGITTTNAGALTVTQLLTANGGIVTATNNGITINNGTAGTGTIVQNFSIGGSGSATTIGATDTATASTNTVNGIQLNLAGTTSSASNTINALSFTTVTPQTNNTFNGLNFGTGYTNLIQSANFAVTAAVLKLSVVPPPLVHLSSRMVLNHPSTITSAGRTATLALSIPADNSNSTDTLCLQTLANCTSTGGISNFINNNEASLATEQTTANFFIQGISTGNSVTAKIQGATGSGDILDLYTNAGVTTPALAVSTAGNLSFGQASTINVINATTGTQLTIAGGSATTGTNVGGNLVLQGGAGASTGASGSVIVKSNGNNSTTAFQIQNAAAASILTADTTANTLNLSGTLNLAQVAAPTGTVTGTAVAGGSLTNPGTYYYAVTYVTASGQTNYGAISAGISTTATNKQINLSNIPISPSALVTGRAIYRTTATGASTGPFFLVTTLANNTATTFSDTIADGSLGAAASDDNHTAQINVNGNSILTVSTLADANTFIGLFAGLNNTSGSFETAIGPSALEDNTTGNQNTAIGYFSLNGNTTGFGNTGIGPQSLQNSTTGNYNVGIGYFALQNAQTIGGNIGQQNTAIGSNAGLTTTTGQNDTFIGFQAGDTDGNSFSTLATLQNATAIGSFAQVQQSNSLILGSTGTSGTTNVGIGTTAPDNLFSVSPIGYSTGTASMGASSPTVTGSSTVWTSAMIGDDLIFANGDKYTVTNVSSNTSMTVTPNSGAGGESSQAYRLQIPALQVTSGGMVGIGDSTPTANLQVTTQTNTTTAFQVQNAAGTSILNVDTANTQIIVGASTIAAVEEATFSAVNQPTLQVNPTNIGDVMVLGVEIGTGSATVSSVTGGGVDHWTKVTSAGTDLEIWEGTITSTGTTNINVNYSTTPGHTVDLNAQEFTAGLGAGTNWTVNASGTKLNTSSTTITYPSLTPTISGGVYIGFSQTNTGEAPGTTPGFSYYPTSTGNITTYDTNTAAGTAYQPTASQTPAANSLTAGVVLTATPGQTLSVNGSTVINSGNSTISEASGFPVSTSGTGTATQSINPQHVGDLVTFVVAISSNTITTTGVSGGNATGWTKVNSFTDATTTKHYELWTATAVNTGSANVSVSYSGSVASTAIELVADSLTTNAPLDTSWAVDTSASLAGDTASTAISWPQLFGSQTNEAYWGFVGNNGTGTVGSTPSTTYHHLTDAAAHWVAESFSTTNAAYQPTMTQTSSTYNSIALMVRANTNALQVENSSGSNLLSVNAATGNLLVNGSATFQDTTNSTTAFQVQNTTGTSNLFVADTVDNAIGIGTTANAQYGVDIALAAPNVSQGAGLGITSVLSSTSNNQDGLYVAPVINPASAAAATYSAIGFNATSSSNNLTGSFLAGATGGITYNGTGTLGASFGLYLQNSNGAGAIGSNYGAYIANTTNGGTIVSNTGLYVAQQTAGLANTALMLAGSTNGLLAVTGTGQTTLQNSANSANAFQIQNSAGTSLFNVDTNGSDVNIDALTAPGTVTASLAPVAPVVTKTGTGTATYAYEVVGVDANGATTLASPASTASTTAPNTLTGGAAQESLNITSTGAASYLIYRTTATAATGGTGSATLGLIGSTTTTGAAAFIDSGQFASQPAPTTAGALTASTKYWFKVTALDGTGGQTVASAEVSATTGTTTASRAVTVSWDPVTGARGYNVYYQQGGGTGGAEANFFTTNTNSYTMITTTGNTAASPPTSNTAYTDTLGTSGDSQITLGGATGSASSAQLDVAGIVPTTVTGSLSLPASSTPKNEFVSGNYDYITASSANTLNIIDISNPANPVQVNGTGTTTNAGPRSVYVSGNYAYVEGSTANTLQVFDVSNPASPVSVASVSTGAGTDPIGLYVQGHYAYVTDDSLSEMQVFNISDPTSPVMVSSITLSTSLANPDRVYVQGKFAYVAFNGGGTTGGFEVIDISNPLAPVIDSSTATANPTGPTGPYVQGNYLYFIDSQAARLQIFNISNPFNPVAVNGAGTTLAAVNPYAMSIQGHYAYITEVPASGTAFLETLDISTPASPTSMGTVAIGTTLSAWSDLRVQGRYAYVTTTNSSTVNTLQIYDMGGAYVQQLQAGGAETGTLQVDSNASVGGDLAVQGGFSTGENIQDAGSIAVVGGATIQGTTVLTGGANQLATPAAPTVTPTGGTAAAKTYSYVITAINAYGGETGASPTGSTAVGYATLTNTAFNALSWTAVPGASGYKIYRTVVTGGSPTTLGLIGSSTTNSFHDTGLAAAGNSAPTTNTTAQLTVVGSALVQTSTDTTGAFQIQNASGRSVLDVDTSLTGTYSNSQVVIDSGVAGVSGLQFSQLNSTSAFTTNFTDILGLDANGNVGVSSVAVSLTSPALAYWDGTADPTITSNSYPQATVQSLGTHAYTPNFTTANGEQLTDNNGNETGDINWNFAQVPFEESQFQFKSGGAGGTGADGVWFYSYTDAAPTTEYGAGMTKGYIIYFSEYHHCIGIAYSAFTDQNQCDNGGGTTKTSGGAGAGTIDPLVSVNAPDLNDANWHDVDVQINYNIITVRYDGAVVLTYTDSVGRDTSGLNFGFGARTGGSFDNHYIKGLLVTKLGTNTSPYDVDSTNSLATTTPNSATTTTGYGGLYWDNSDGFLGVGSAGASATLDVSGTFNDSYIVQPYTFGTTACQYGNNAACTDQISGGTGPIANGAAYTATTTIHKPAASPNFSTSWVGDTITWANGDTATISAATTTTLTVPLAIEGIQQYQITAPSLKVDGSGNTTVSGALAVTGSSTLTGGVTGGLAVTGALSTTTNLTVGGSFTGHTVLDKETTTGTHALTEATAALGYSLWVDVGNTVTTDTFNITGVSNTEGAEVYISSIAQRTAAGTNAITATVQINGTQISQIVNTTSGAVAINENYIAMFINGSWQIIAYGATAANPAGGTLDTADYAEWIDYSGDTAPQPGDVLTVGANAKSVADSSTPYDSDLIGVVSTSPYQVGGTDDGHSVILALTGRAPVNVSLENGPIEPGDPLTSSSTPGVAMKAISAGNIIGTALEAYDGTQNTSQIDVQLHVGYDDPGTVTGQLQGDQTVTGGLTVDGNTTLQGSVSIAQNLSVAGNTSLQGDLNVTGNTTLASLLVNGNLNVNGNLTVSGTASFGGDIKLTAPVNTRQATVKTFKASKAIAAGSVVVLDTTPGNEGQVTTTTIPDDPAVIGVAVTSATGAGDSVDVAIGGWVQVLADTTPGSSGNPPAALTPGQLLVTSTGEGTVQTISNPTPGSILGKSTSTQDPTSNLVWTLVTLQ